MFDRLIASEPAGADARNRRKYFMVSSVIVSVLFTVAVVISIYAADYGLGSSSFELVEMIAPSEMAPVEPETPQPRIQTAQSQSQAPTRQANVARMDETPREIPAEVSTTQPTQKERPNEYYTISKFDTDPAGGQPIGRGSKGPMNAGLGLGTSEAVVTKKEDVDPPPPIVKKDPPPNKAVSRGVLNGRATSLPKPLYSAAAKAVGAQGQVAVQVTIDEHGRVISASAVSGHFLLRPEAERAARNATFTPTLLSDSPVKVTGVITYNFTR